MTDTELTGAGTLTGSVEESGREIGGFVQYRSEVFGVHAAIGGNNTEVDASYRGFFTKIDAGRSVDLLGMVVLEGENINGIGMFGLSALALDFSGGLDCSCNASGIKFAGGIEIPLDNQWNFQVTYEYADLGDITVEDTNDKLEVTHSGIFLRMGYRF